MFKLIRTRSTPIHLATLSLLVLIILAAATSPTSSVGYVIIFLLALLVFLSSVGYLIAQSRAKSSKVSKQQRYKIFMVASFLVVALMLRSVSSLELPEVILLVVLAALLYFYLSRYPD